MSGPDREAGAEGVAALAMSTGPSRDLEQVRRVLTGWLAPRLGGAGLSLSPISTPSGTGVANETLLFEATWAGGGKERTAGFVVRLATERPLYLEADVETHAKIYEVLEDVPGVPVPHVYGYEADRELLGAPFFVMERMYGDVPGDAPSWTASGFVIDAEPTRRRAMWESAVDVLARLHQVDASRFPFLAAKDDSSGLLDHLRYWRRHLDDGEQGIPVDTLERGYEWLLAHLPEPQPTGFSWGDARFANIMFRDDEVVSIFDWDTASLAGPEADLAWWRFMHAPAAGVEGIGTADELVERWQALTGRKVQHLEWHEVFTTFRLGCITLTLFRQMGETGAMSPEVARDKARNNMPAQMLAAQLDALA